MAGSIAAVAASLVSLPLDSPDDAWLNSGSVMAVSVPAGLASGILWRALAGNSRRRLLFAVVWTGGFVIAAIVAFVGEEQIKGSASFIVPLAAIVFSLTGLLTISLSGRSVSRSGIATAAAVIAIGVGVGLAGQGDGESGRLELPPRSALP